jgi:hypothetical protein
VHLSRFHTDIRRCRRIELTDRPTEFGLNLVDNNDCNQTDSLKTVRKIEGKKSHNACMQRKPLEFEKA